ncbi:MAG: ABC transporter permease [Acidobacteria bacterium]|nr:ABC transporter permease [Acidobacteriota bacterium]
MNKIFAIVKKELWQYFFSPIAYIVLASFLLVNSFIFYVVLSAMSKAASPSISPMALLFGGTFFFWLLTIVMIPVITMRLGAEERKSGTIETLLTAPVSDFQIVMGKFLSSFSFYLIAWLLTLVYVFVLKSYGEADFGPILSGYIGVILLGAFFISIGLWATIISRNQITAAIISFSVMALMVGMTFFSFILGGEKKEFFQNIDLLAIMENFSKGVVDSRNVIYLLSGAVFFLALSVKSLEARRWQ